MCGRYALFTISQELARLFGLGDVPLAAPHWNIAPTHRAAVVRADAAPGTPASDVDPDQRRLDIMQWRFRPHWARDPDRLPLMFNARAEEVFDRPAFRDAAKRDRCLVPTDGFFEWKPTGGPRKQPMFIRRPDKRPYAFAGLWSAYEHPDGTHTRFTFTILTKGPDPFMAPIHDRMPLIIEPDQYTRWLDPTTPQPDVEAMMAGPTDAALVADPISDAVNKVDNDGPEVLRPREQQTLF